MLQLALSPYHLATREAPAMLALTLGERIVTLLPRPTRGASREGFKETIEKAPRYLKLMESWRWCGPLWQSGLVSGEHEGEHPADELAGVYETIADNDALAALRPLTRGARERTAESADKSLDFIAGDMVRGGPDPGINIPVAAALDRFAARHGLCSVRSGATSVVQRAESRLGRKVFSVAIPILLRAGGGRIEQMREDLGAELDALRDAMMRALDECMTSGDEDCPPALESLNKAAVAYARAFEHWAVDGAAGDDENAERVTSGYVSVTGMIMPADAVLRSSRAAVRAMQGSSRGDEEPLGPADGELITLVVREMNMRPA